MRFPPNGKAYSVATRCAVLAPDASSVAAAIVKLEGATTGPDKRQVEIWLVALQAATKGAKASEIASMVALDLYTAALMRYPADVAKSACMMMAMRPPTPGETNWFPSLGELIAECDRLVSPRQTMLAGLRAWREPTAAELSAARRRRWQLNEYTARDDAALCRRSDPDRHSELMEFADYARAMSRAA